MQEHFRRFEVGPDPFGRNWLVQFRWLQTGISIRHADTVDVKFFLKCDDGTEEEKVIALPHPALLQICEQRNRKLTGSLVSEDSCPPSAPYAGNGGGH